MNINDQYTIGINLDVNGSSVEMLSKFNTQIDKLTKRFSQLTSNLNKFNKSLGITGDLFERVSGFVSMFTDKTTSSFAMATAEVRRFNRAMNESTGGGGRGGHIGKELGGHFGGMAAGGMGGMLGRAMAPEVAIPAMAGAFVLKSGFGAVSNMQQAQMQLANLGWGQSFVTQASNAAMLQSLPGVSPLEYMQAIGQAAAVSRTPQQTMGLAPFIAKMDFANKLAYSGQGHTWSSSDARNLAQFGEIYSHSFQASKIAAGMSVGEQLYATETGKIPTYYFRDLARRYAVGISQVSPLGLFQLLPILQTLGGSQTGAALATLQSQLSKGQNFKTGKKAMRFLESIGVMDAKGKMQDQELFYKNPDQWITQFFAGQLRSHGIKSESAMASAVSVAFTQRVARLIMVAIQNTAKSQQAGIEGMKAMGTQGVYATTLGTNAGQMASVAASWNKFSLAFGRLTNPLIVTALGNLTTVINAFSSVLTTLGAPLQKLVNALPGAPKGFTRSGMLKNAFGFAAQGFIATPYHEAENKVINLYLDGKKFMSAMVDRISGAASSPQAASTSTLHNFALAQPGNNLYGNGTR
jgi:hypothetical protein